MEAEMDAVSEFYFQWHITERCNKSCRHCYQNGHGGHEMSLSDLERVLTRIDLALAKWNRQGSLSFTGGEPFVRQSALFALMKRTDETDTIAFYDILTNGSLISEDIASALQGYRKLRRIQVSLEGSTPAVNDAIRGKGSYVDTLNAIRTMKAHGLTVGVMTTVSKLNCREVLGLVELLSDLGVDTFAVERLIPEGRGQQLKSELLSPRELRELYERLYDMKSRTRGLHVLMNRPLFSLIAPDDSDVGALCSAGNNALTIMPDGTVYPCRRLPIPIGNVLTDGLFSIWYDSEVLWRIRNPDNLPEKCRACDLLTACRGCRAMAYSCTGDYMAEDAQCWR